MYEITRYTLDANGQRLIAHCKGAAPVVKAENLTAAERQILGLLQGKPEPETATQPAPEPETAAQFAPETEKRTELDTPELPEDADAAAEVVQAYIENMDRGYEEIPPGADLRDYVFRAHGREFIIASGAGSAVIEVNPGPGPDSPAETAPGGDPAATATAGRVSEEPTAGAGEAAGIGTDQERKPGFIARTFGSKQE